MTKKINLIFLSALVFYSLYCSIQLGETWDSFFHYNIGKDRLDYLFSLGLNEVNKNPFNNKFYTGAYSTISALFVQSFPRKYIIEALYIFNLSFSILTVFGIYNVTKELFNKKIGQIAFLLCFFNPIFFGHMAMNSSDTIIAFANIWFFYSVLKYFKYQKATSKKNNYLIASGLLLGLGQGVRYSFIITLFPIILFFIIEIFYLKILIDKKFSKKAFFVDSVKVLIIGYLFMVLFWPQTHANIFLLPFKLAIEGLSFPFGVPFLLFNGEIFQTEGLPKNYILINLFYKMPEFIILSFLLFILFFIKLISYFKKKITGFKYKIFLIFIIILFPNFLLLFSPWGLYDGVRFFLYLIPYICIIPAILIFFLLKNIKENLHKITFSLLAFGIIFFLFNFFSLTPYQYVYLNIFAGNYSENSQKFENDYWGVSTNKLISQISNNKEIMRNSSVKIATCGLPEASQSRNLKKLKNFNFKLVNMNDSFDFIIMNNRAIWDAKNTEFDPKKSQTCFEKFLGKDILTVKRRGLVLAKITRIIE